MAVPMIVFAWLYIAAIVEGRSIIQDCYGAQECCIYLPVSSQEFQDCCFRHGCCPKDCNYFADASCCYNTTSYHLGSIVARLPKCCINLVCGARISDTAPFITTSIVPVSLPQTPGHYCGTPKFGYCVQVNGIIRNEGSEWFETPCRHCRCEKGEITCRSVRPVCPPAPEPHCHSLPGDCCPTWDCTPVNAGCKDGDNEHRLGDTWTDPSDPCKLWLCTINGKVPLPPKPCPPLSSPPHRHCTVVVVDCCPTWNCSTGCVDEYGLHHNLGDVWTDPAHSCVTLNCTISGIQKSNVICPPMTSPPQSYCKLKLEHCCYVWICNVPTGCVDYYGINHNEGEVWVDQRDPCTTHMCTSSGIHSYEKQCPSPGPKPNERCRYVIVNCCHQWNCSTTGCVDESGHHNLGDVWTNPANPCYTLSCTHGGIQRKRSPCPDLSPRPSPSCTIELQGCCYNWTCPITTGCVDYSGHHNLGDVWTDPADPCYILSCTHGAIQRSLVSCPPLSTPPSLSCTIELQGCCYNWTCKTTPGCVDDSGHHHNLDHVWADPADPCYTLTCTPSGIQKSLLPCPPLSPPPDHSCNLVLYGCCYNWTCQDLGCIDENGGHRDIGEQWSHSTFPCINYKCSKTGILKYPTECPALGPSPHPTCKEVEQDCCRVWDCPNLRDCPDPYSFNRVCIRYHDQCSTNSDCYSGSLCCLVAGCGKECIPVSDGKPGNCPLIGLPDNAFPCYQHVEECQQDQDCSGTKKCCESFCGKKCSDAVN